MTSYNEGAIEFGGGREGMGEGDLVKIVKSNPPRTLLIHSLLHGITPVDTAAMDQISRKSIWPFTQGKGFKSPISGNIWVN